jgi:MscS family membrane protein
MINFNQSFFIQKTFIHFIQIIFCLCQLSFSTSSADETNPLKPIDTSSPRSTLQGFLETTNKAYINGHEFVESLHSPQHLYFSKSDLTALRDGNLLSMESAQRTLNLSEVPPDMLYGSSRRLVVQLKEILDRIDLPPFEAIPDESIMSKSENKYWSIPGTEIKLARVESGPQKGEYLFTSSTISRLPEFYLKVKNMPYKPGASIGWYDMYSNSPIGLAYLFPRLIPISFISNPPAIIQVHFLGQPLWRWLCIVTLFIVGFFIILLSQQIKYYLAKRLSSKNRPWANLLLPLSLTTLSPSIALFIDKILRTSGLVYQVLTLSLWTLFYIALTWTVWSTGSAIAESVISYEKLRVSSIDSQLIRLLLRIVTLIISITIIIMGANHIGLPAYSIMAGLGVSGLAVALAAQQTLSNLIASIIIMIEKPFALGHRIKIKDIEGDVEDVGFRSTTIRTVYDSLITIPNHEMICNAIDNMTSRSHRVTEVILTLKYDISIDEIESFIEDTKILLQENPKTRKDKIYVSLDSLGLQGCPVIKIKYRLKVINAREELKEKDKIFLDIMRLADSLNVKLMTVTQ